MSLAWTPDGTCLLSGGYTEDPTIQKWDAFTWQHVGGPWTGHAGFINAIAIHPAGALVATTSSDNHHTSATASVTFSRDGKHILSGGQDMISEWAVPNLSLIQREVSILDSDNAIRACFTPQILLNTAAHHACIARDWSTAEQLLTQDINTDANNYTSYADCSLIMARKHHWHHALQDAMKSVNIQPSVIGYISKGIAFCGNKQAIAIFNADYHEEAMLLIREPAVVCLDTLACRVVEAYLCVQLGINATDDGRHNEAADHFTDAVNASAFSSKSPIHSMYKDFVVLFGWDLKSLWRNAHQKQCDALLRAGRFQEALESHRDMLDKSDQNTKAIYLDWSNGKSRQECSPLCSADGDAALAACDYDRAIALYSAVINLNSPSDTILANRSKARLGISLWEDVLVDAHKVIELNPSSHVGYQLKHAALHGAQRYDEAMETLQMMLLKLDDAPDTQIRNFFEQYVSPSEAAIFIQKVIGVQLDAAPLRLLNTATGLLCGREAQICAFKTSTEYTELLLSTMKHPDLRMERIADAVAAYFRCAMLSHRWEGREPLLHNIQGKVVYKLKAAGGLMKLQNFCKVARDVGYHWAWVDSCCIDQNNNVELSTSLNSMFAWYRHSALTAVYLSDVPPLSKSGALGKSAWNTRGWTVPEFLAPKVIRFYQQDWTPYLDDRSLNHKESSMIMGELQDVTGIDACALVAYQPGMGAAREKLQWASARVTTVQEDIAYSLFGIFGVQLPILYGEKKQNALGRLLQEIVARSGDITVLDWVGRPSEFNSCLPADITSYAALPRTLPSLSEDEIQLSVSSLQNTVPVEFASKFYTLLDNTSAPRFANCRLHLPCITFRVTEVRRRHSPAQEIRFTYGVKADGLRDLLITTEETLTQFSRAKPTRQTFLLVRPWDHCLLELPDFAEHPAFADDVESIGDWSEPGSPLDDSDESPGGSPVEEELDDLESHSRALRLIVRLGQPFGAFLLGQQRGGEYKRMASDRDIVAQVRDVASVHSMMDIRTLEVL
ncbi:hypothetical protein DFH29DRAFT_1078588 [Suillus ampliporus]|nr:hypothetical protein DFH29DRAFT_1078588 [Suillus ampliporus]